MKPLTKHDKNLLALGTDFKNEFEPLRRAAQDAETLLSDIIEIANQRGEFLISRQDYLYYRIGELRDAIRSSMPDNSDNFSF